MQRVLVAGGSGYFGSLLLRRLRAEGAAARVLDLHDADDRPADVELVRGDVGDPAVAAAACRGIDVLYHCVAQVPLARDPGLQRRVNVEGTRTLLEAARSAGIRKVVALSSSAVYGAPDRNPVDEATPPTPAEPYGRSKWEAEQVCEEFAAKGLDVTRIRPRTILGHGRLGIFQMLFEWVRSGKPVPVLGSGDNRYQFVHADDLADACLRAAARPGPALYACGAARFGSMGDALRALCRHAKTGSTVRRVPRALAEGGMRLASGLGLSPLGPYHALMYGRSLWFDISKATSELGWAPRWSNEDMIVQSYDWYLRNRESILAARGGSPHRRALKAGVLSLVPFLLELA